MWSLNFSLPTGYEVLAIVIGFVVWRASAQWSKVVGERPRLVFVRDGVANEWRRL